MFPEANLYFNSGCQHLNVLKTFDGTIFGYKVFPKVYKKPPNNHVVTRNVNTYDRRRRCNNEPDSIDTYDYISKDESNFVVFWGTHHKTGTYLAQKLSSTICVAMKWCCIFHVTRDSTHALQKSFGEDTVHSLAHSQWIWYPEEFGLRYKFVHMYRAPVQKLISGWGFHMHGVEGWTRSPDHSYPDVCTDPLRDKAAGLPIKRNALLEHCHHVHLCEACCRREHENRFDRAIVRDNQTEALSSMSDAYNRNKTYTTRKSNEYKILCKNLSKIKKNISLSDNYKSMSTEDGLMAEASLSFYENLRMARIYNHTYRDPNTLNIDLDDISRDFKGSIRRIMNHLQLGLDDAAFRALERELQFYDLETSPMYKWTMESRLIKHVNTDGNNKRPEIKGIAEGLVASGQSDLAILYQEIFDLMYIPSRRNHS